MVLNCRGYYYIKYVVAFRQIDKYIKQNCAPSWIYLRYYTGMHHRQNIKSRMLVLLIYDFTGVKCGSPSLTQTTWKSFEETIKGG